MTDITRSVSGLQVDSAFPGLPSPQRRAKTAASPWAHAASSSGGIVQQDDEWELEDSETGTGGKKKGKGKKVLMHFG